jgi:hypothetical protein
MTEEPAVAKKHVYTPPSNVVRAQLFQKTSGFNYKNLGSGLLMESPLLYKDSAKRLLGGENDPIHPFLYHILKLGTPHKHEVELLPFMKKYIAHKIHIDSIGNAFFIVGKGKPETMFSCHMDTVHKKLSQISVWATVGPNEQANDFIFGSRMSSNSTNGVPCNVGADDRVGMYIMMRLANAKVPGLYYFHVGEECGGIGSRGAVEKFPEKFKDIKRCIAFDRKGYNEVITHQGGQECASEEFGKAMAQAINSNLTEYAKSAGEYTYAPSRHGVFTDSKNYFRIIPECINLSVGYFDHHQVTEHFDAVWLDNIFIPALKKIEFDALPTARDPKKEPPNKWWGGTSYYNNQKTTREFRDGVWVTVVDPLSEDTTPLLPRCDGGNGNRVSGIDKLTLSTVNELTHFGRYPDVDPATVVWPAHITLGLKKAIVCTSFIRGKINVDELVEHMLIAQEDRKDLMVQNKRLIEMNLQLSQKVEAFENERNRLKDIKTLISQIPPAQPAAKEVATDVDTSVARRRITIGTIGTPQEFKQEIASAQDEAGKLDELLFCLHDKLPGGTERAAVSAIRIDTTSVIDELDTLETIMEDFMLVYSDDKSPLRLVNEVQSFQKTIDKLQKCQIATDVYLQEKAKNKVVH